MRRKMAIQEMAAGLSVTQAGLCEKKTRLPSVAAGQQRGGASR